MATQNRQRRREVNSYRQPRSVNRECLDMESKSLVEICGTYRTKCGYCKPDTKTSVSYGLLAKRLTCADYQELIDRGWRRSGTFVYKPVMHETCCPQYTIRLDVTRFKPTKGQRHVLNRLRRYLDGEHTSNSNSSSASGRRDSAGREAPATAGFKGDSGGRDNKRDVSRQRGSDARRAGGDGSSRDGDGPENSEKLRALGELVAAAAVAAVEGGVISALEAEPGWRSKVAGWSQVKPIRNKSCRVSGGGFCSTVALNIASAARKRGWKATGGAGGAVAVAEAIAGGMRGGGFGEGGGGVAEVSDVTVAPNGFINFAAEIGSSSADAPQQDCPIPPSHAVGQATAGKTALSPATPPPPPPPAPALQGNASVQHNASASTLDAPTKQSPVKEAPISPRAAGLYGSGVATEGVPSPSTVVPVGAARDGGSCSGLEGMETDFPSVASGLEGGAAALRAHNGPVGQMGTVGHGGGAVSHAAAAAAPMEWMERQGNDAGMMDVQVSSVATSAAAAAATAESTSSTGLSSLPPLDPGLAPHRMTVSTVPARLTEEVFRLYLKYQVSVHGDQPSEVTPGQFCRFLVDSPLIRETVGGQICTQKKNLPSRGLGRRSVLYGSEDAMDKGETEDECAEITEGRHSLSVPYGSYHQLYRIDGRLVAVGVVDVLPKCLSSVYCFYDPDFRALALGKLTALKETEFVRDARSLRPTLCDYYMGFYIHTCPKMSYKGSYTPSFLLCPERLSWVPLELCRPVLDNHKYARLSELLDPPLRPPEPPNADFGRGVPTGNGSESNGVGPVGGFSGVGSSRRRASTNSQQRHAAGSTVGAGSLSTEQRIPCSSSSPPSLSPDRRVVGQGRPRVQPSFSARNVPTGGSGTGLRRSGGNEPMEVAEADVAARRAAAARAARLAADEASGMNEIPLIVGHPPFPVSLTALTPQSQHIVRDALRTYVTAIGSDLAKKVLLKLHD